MASITTPDARTLIIKPWEKSIIGEIEKVIINSDLGLNPQNDGEIVSINIPVLTEERRIILVKQAKAAAENGKISIRNIRKETNEQLRKLLNLIMKTIRLNKKKIQILVLHLCKVGNVING